MKRHRTDALSLIFGGLFLLIVAWWLVANAVHLHLPHFGWFVALALIAIGVAGLLGVARGGRTARGDTAPITPPAPAYWPGPEYGYPDRPGGAGQTPYGGATQTPYGGATQTPYGGAAQTPYGGDQQSPYSTSGQPTYSTSGQATYGGDPFEVGRMPDVGRMPGEDAPAERAPDEGAAGGYRYGSPETSGESGDERRTR